MRGVRGLSSLIGAPPVGSGCPASTSTGASSSHVVVPGPVDGPATGIFFFSHSADESSSRDVLFDGVPDVSVSIATGDDVPNAGAIVVEEVANLAKTREFLEELD